MGDWPGARYLRSAREGAQARARDARTAQRRQRRFAAHGLVRWTDPATGRMVRWRTDDEQEPEEG